MAVQQAARRVSIGMVGATSGEQWVQWNEREAMLYAIGVGAGLGAPEQELSFTTENSGGNALRTLPSFLTILAARHMPAAMQTLDAGQFLHGEQQIEILTPLPTSGSGLVSSTIESVLDKGSGALITILATLNGSGPDRPVIGRSRMSIFVRGAGGFGGPRGTVQPYALPGRASDVRIIHQTRPEQALVYRLSGDHNRLHTDPDFARARGFERPILHGLCTYGFACRALIQGVCAGDAARLAGMSGRFRKPIYPGDKLTTDIWVEPSNILFQTLDSSGDAAIERGRAQIAN